MATFIIGGGTDGPGFIIRNGKLIPVPGWNPEAMLDFGHAMNIIKEARRIKNPALADHITKVAVDFAQKELATHFKEDGVVALA